MRLLHTSDWHLGHTLRERSRAYEHAAFLGWLLDRIEEHAVDGLLVAGDVFETANPAADAQQAWYDFLAEARRRFPDLDIVVVGGNHDSAARLDAPTALLRALRLHVVGGVDRVGGALELERLVVPIHGRDGSRAWVAAVPFLRASDLPIGLAPDQLEQGVVAVYADVLEHVRSRRADGEAIVAMGHLYMIGGAISEESERKILGGNQHAVSLGLFPDDVAYAALGHLHLAQAVGDAAHVRYSGAPIPLSMAEATYPHQVVLVELEGGRLRETTTLRVPRAVEMRRVPAKGAASLAEVLELLEALPSRGTVPEPEHTFLEVAVACTGPEPGLIERISDALADRAAFLVKVTRTLASSSDSTPAPAFVRREYSPEEVFVEKWRRDYGTEPSAGHRATFHELLEAAQQETP